MMVVIGEDVSQLRHLDKVVHLLVGVLVQHVMHFLDLGSVHLSELDSIFLGTVEEGIHLCDHVLWVEHAS